MQQTLDTQRVQTFAGQLLGDLGATISAALIHVGDRLGLYRALAEAGPLSSAELAQHTSTSERYVREWLANQCASGYLEYQPETQTYLLPAEHAAVLADEQSPAFMVGGFQTAVGVYQVLDQVEAAFRSDEGIDWGDHDAHMFCGVERFFGPAYRNNLVQEWLPALEGVQAKLEAGARVADVGCGHGKTAVLMARAYPASTVVGIDVHAPSIATAEQRARDAGVDDRVHFECAGAQDYAGREFDLISFFDCLHDMGDPVAAMTHAREILKPDGTVLLVEPFAHDTLAENLNPVGRMYYSFSTTVCTPSALSQEGGMSLGAQAGEARLKEVATKAGFTRFRRATETPFNMILEARP